MTRFTGVRPRVGPDRRCRLAQGTSRVPWHQHRGTAGTLGRARHPLASLGLGPACDDRGDTRRQVAPHVAENSIIGPASHYRDLDRRDTLQRGVTPGRGRSLPVGLPTGDATLVSPRDPLYYAYPCPGAGTGGLWPLIGRGTSCGSNTKSTVAHSSAL